MCPQIAEAIDSTDKGTKTKTKAQEGIVKSTIVEKEKKKEKVKKTKELTAKDLSQRPPLEQITSDFESVLKDLEIDGKKLVKLGYKCGKIIYGLKSSGKDFRVIAFKARKKTKTVNNKSRGIFYFGVDQKTAKELTKAHKELKISSFGKCSVQSATPVELILDRTTYTENFEKDAEKVLALMSTAAASTIESKNEQWTAKQTAEAAAEKPEKTSK